MAKNQWAWAVLVFAVSLADGIRAGELPRAQPQELGFSAERLAYMDQFYAERVRNGEIAGIVILISRHGKIAHFSAIGYADVERRQEIETDSFFRLYSMTKPIASVALMILHEEGRFQLTDPLSKYLPEFANLQVLRDPEGALDDTVTPTRAPTIHDVLRHTAGFTHGLTSDAYDKQYTKVELFESDLTLAESMSKLARIPLRYQPGTKFAYSVGPDVQARLVEVLSGLPFDQFLEKRLFEPLGMKDTNFWVPADHAQRLAAVHTVKDGKLVPEHWESDSHTAEHKRKGGSYGLVSTAEDYWRFAQMMLNGGELDGVRILGSRTVRYMTRDHLGGIDGLENEDGTPSGSAWGLGFGVIQDPVAAGSLLSEGTFYHAGAAATLFWVDPREDLVIVAMTQHFGAPGAESLGAQIPTLVYSALAD